MNGTRRPERGSAQSGTQKVERVTTTGSFFIPMPCEQAFDLFTAAGERAWVSGWDPIILGDLPQTSGLVFLTGSAAHETIWIVIGSDPQTCSHRYCRVTPGVHAGIVEVRLCSEAGGSRVQVGYDMTALPGAPPDCLDQYGEERFTEMLADWSKMIRSALQD